MESNAYWEGWYSPIGAVNPYQMSEPEWFDWMRGYGDKMDAP